MSTFPMRTRLLPLLLSGLVAVAQTFDTPAALTPEARTALARQILAAGTAQDEAGLYERMRLQIQAQDLDGALLTTDRLDLLPKGALDPSRSRARSLFELHARTLKVGAVDAAFAAMAKGLSDPAAYRLCWALAGDGERAERDLQARWEGLKGKAALSRAEAVGLLLDAELRDAMKLLLPKAAALARAEEGRRYVIDENVRIRTPKGVVIAATLVRPRTSRKLPTAFEFTIYANEGNRIEALRSASEGFIGLVANTRGKRGTPGPVEPYEHDGEDAAAVIDWVAKQPWSDGQVGMFGGSYDGFTQWAAAKHRPRALKSIMPSVAVCPGIDVPMEGGVFQTFLYRWIPYVTKLPGLDEAGYGDFARWNGLDQGWFDSGRPYREESALDREPNPLWLRWLSHPTYDAYWQAMTTSEKDFAAMNIPVLATTGYFDGCLLSSLHYFESHLAARPGAEHYFLVGPYNHIGAQRRSMDLFGGYRIDPSARLDIEALRYQWLNHTLKGGPRPELLKARVNYQVMGADTWKHADSIAAMGPERLTYHLASDLRLSPAAAPGTARLEVDLAERKTQNSGSPDLIEAKEVDASNCLRFESAPLEAPLELSGCFEGELAFTTNKRDFDLNLQLFERMEDGRYFNLSYLIARASQMPDRHRRQLLRPGQPTHLPYRSGRLVSRRLAKGSRLVLLVGVLKHPGAQVNYGTGKDVSDESIQDAGAPLRIDLEGRSTLVLPVAE